MCIYIYIHYEYNLGCILEFKLGFTMVPWSSYLCLSTSVGWFRLLPAVAFWKVRNPSKTDSIPRYIPKLPSKYAKLACFNYFWTIPWAQSLEKMFGDMLTRSDKTPGSSPFPNMNQRWHFAIFSSKGPAFFCIKSLRHSTCVGLLRQWQLWHRLASKTRCRQRRRGDLMNGFVWSAQICRIRICWITS